MPLGHSSPFSRRFSTDRLLRKLSPVPASPSPRIWSKCALIRIRFISPYPWGIVSRKRKICLFAHSPVLPHRTLAGSLFRRYAPYVHCRKHSLLRELLVPGTSLREKRPFSNGLFSIQSEGVVWNHPQGVWNPSQSDGMAYSLLAHRLHGGTSCYVPSLTERSRSNLHSLADKQACRLASLDYHASACILLRIDYFLLSSFDCNIGFSLNGYGYRKI